MSLDWDLSEFSAAELSTLKTNILAKVNEMLTGVESGSLEGGAFKNVSFKDLKELQGAVNGELRARADTTGGLIGVEFERASD